MTIYNDIDNTSRQVKSLRRFHLQTQLKNILKIFAHPVHIEKSA